MTKKDTVADNSAEKAAGKASEKTIIVTKVEKGEFDAYIVGDSPLLMQKMSEKTKRDLLFPPLKKNKTERETTLKHEPRREFRISVTDLMSDKDTARQAMDYEIKRVLALMDRVRMLAEVLGLQKNVDAMVEDMRRLQTSLAA